MSKVKTKQKNVLKPWNSFIASSRCTLQIKPLKKLTWHSSCYNLFGNSIPTYSYYLPSLFPFLHFIISTYCILMLYINSLTNINEKTELKTFSFFMLFKKTIKIPKNVKLLFFYSKHSITPTVPFLTRPKYFIRLRLRKVYNAASIMKCLPRSQWNRKYFEVAICQQFWIPCAQPKR